MEKITISKQEYFQLFSSMIWMQYRVREFSIKQLTHIADSDFYPQLKDAALYELERRKAEITAAIANVTNDIPA